MDQWVKDTASQGAEPAGAKITMANWAQYKQFMPLGMQKLFEGEYYWKMPADVEMNVGPAVYNTFLPKTWVEATEKYGPQTGVDILPNGHYVLKNYHGGTPFPNPAEPNKGWKVLANVFWAFVPSVYVNSPNNFVFVPALRRSLRLASTARCSPVFGFDWSYDDAKTNGFNGSTSIYTGDFLADRKILTLAHFNEDGA